MVTTHWGPSLLESLYPTSHLISTAILQVSYTSLSQIRKARAESAKHPWSHANKFQIEPSAQACLTSSLMLCKWLSVKMFLHFSLLGNPFSQ